MNQLFKNVTDYFQNVDKYFATEDKREIYKVFEWEKSEINSDLKNGNYERVDMFFTFISTELKHEWENPKIYEISKSWILENFDLIKKTIQLTYNNNMKETSFLFIKFVRYKDFKYILDLIFYLYHILRFHKNYNDLMVNTALIGIYRYGLVNLIDDLKQDVRIKDIDKKIQKKDIYSDFETKIEKGSKDKEFFTYLVLSDYHNKANFGFNNKEKDILSCLKEIKNTNIALNRNELIYDELEVVYADLVYKVKSNIKDSSSNLEKIFVLE